MSAEQRLQERLDDVLRTSAGNQAKAYQDYAALLDRLASSKIKPVDFARDAVDLYLGALGKAASAGVTLAGEVVSAGLKGVGIAADAFERGAKGAVGDIAPTRSGGAKGIAPAAAAKVAGRA